MSLGDDVLEQYRRVLAGWQEMIGLCPEGEWRQGERQHLTPARAAVHAIETIEFYAHDGPDDYQWGYRFGIDWRQTEADRLPSRQDMAAYTGEVAQWLAGVLGGLSDEQMMAATAFPWTGATRLSTLLYCLRHTQQHLGQVGAVLQGRGLAAAHWH